MIDMKFINNEITFNKYLEVKNTSFKSEEDKYLWSLLLEDVIFGYLGVNKSIFSSSNELKEASLYSYQNVFKCSIEEASTQLNKIANLIENVEIEYNKLKQEISINKYIKSLLYKYKYFAINPRYKYNNLKLLSLTIGNNTNAYYEVSEYDDYTMRKHKKDGDTYFERAVGTFLKDELKFNVNQNDIIKIRVIENNITKDYTIKQFEKKHGNFKNFIYKELSHLTLEDTNEIVNKAIELVSKFINIRILTDIYFVDEIPFSSSSKTVGKYAYGDIYIINKPTRTDKLEILIHEIGHYIHEVYFNNKQFRFSTENKSNYAKTNYKENFAECFTDLVYYKKDNERTRKMIKILDDII